MTDAFHLVAPGRATSQAGPAELGNKGWNLTQMAQIGLPVPPAAILPTSLCGKTDGIDAIVAAALRELEGQSRKAFGGHRRPLLLSVRSGAAVSMPGMMDTLLDVGMNDEVAAAMIRATGNPALAWDCYRRLIQSYGTVVAGLPAAPFHQAATDVADLSFEGLRTLVREHLALYRELAGEPFPQDVQRQLRESVRAVFASWNGDKAVSYRRLHGIDDSAGTAAILQCMVFGNMGGFSGTGVGFTRDPADGADRLYLDFLFQGQGEDIVAGKQRLTPPDRLAALLPGVWAQLQEVRAQLERHFGDAQDFEFTVEEGRLWMLQTRSAKRTPWAALHIALDLCEQGIIGRDAALALLADIDVEAIARRRLANPHLSLRIGAALVASPGCAAGRAAFDLDATRSFAAEKAPVILIRPDATTEDVEAMHAAAGILTAAGGRTSHAAVVARQLDKVCLVDCRDLSFEQGGARIGEHHLKSGDWLTLDGNDGAIYAGRAQFTAERPTAALGRLAALRGYNQTSIPVEAD
jgi:pyruvate,orthophosphate dikinase